MPVSVNRQILLVSRPQGEPKASNFKLVETTIPSPGDGQVLCRTIFLSLDPYMRGRMNAGKNYAKPVELGEVMEGGTVGQVVESRHPDFSEGEIVVGAGGWQEYFSLPARALRKVDPAEGPVSTAVGVLGMPGMTAYTGLLNIGKPEEGETVVVAAASGAVGSVVGQIARIKGARAVGIAGSAEKCRFVTGELGFDACLNHRDANFAEQVEAACPDGIDVYFENVAGKVFETVLPLFNNFARIPVCGTIAIANATSLPPGPNQVPMLLRQILTKRLTFRGFIVGDYVDQKQEAFTSLAKWIREGKLRFHEDIVDGLEKAPEALSGLLRGENFGKLVVRVANDSTLVAS